MAESTPELRGYSFHWVRKGLQVILPNKSDSGCDIARAVSKGEREGGSRLWRHLAHRRRQLAHCTFCQTESLKARSEPWHGRFYAWTARVLLPLQTKEITSKTTCFTAVPIKNSTFQSSPMSSLKNDFWRHGLRFAPLSSYQLSTHLVCLILQSVIYVSNHRTNFHCWA